MGVASFTIEGEMTRIDEKQTAVSKEFGRLRSLVGVSQADVATKLKTTQKSVWAFEQGKTERPRTGMQPYLDLMNEWRQKLGVEKLASSETVILVTCRECKEEVPSSVHGRTMYCCGACGADLGNYCEACGNWNPARKKFCGDCGAPLTDAAETAAHDTRPALRTPRTRQRRQRSGEIKRRPAGTHQAAWAW